jgi:hypothetical protein
MRRALLVLLVLSACEEVPVVPGADKRQNAQLSRIEGEVVVTSTQRGNAIVLLFDAARPPPPLGTGRPLSFTVVPRDELFGAAADGDGGPFTAKYAFSLVGPGRYLIRAFIDANADFIPWYGVTGEVNAGDVGGAAIDALTRGNREVVISDSLEPALDVPVSISDAARVPVDRPVFRNADGSAELQVTAGGAPRIVDLVPNPINDGLVHQGQPAFLARFLDDNLDGVPDDANGDGVPELWPRVVVRKLTAVEGKNPLLDENDLDRNGVLDEGGVDYEHLNPTNGQTISPDGASDLVVLAAGFDPSPIAMQLVDSMGRVKPTPTPVASLRLVVRATALDASGATPVPLKTLPSGRYAIVLIQQTGQTWRVPNELSPGIAEGIGFPAVPSQAFVVVVP